ncbi:MULTISPECIES: DUF4139 domain-containing protein [unclassified Lentimonas]|uniref:DUF4139 domain-containing protein n=1 Tax=unclassified Lentimonas TaxID=2630993 RepID=UPI0013254291|nr:MULTISPECIES: DUF4139 domain-containing protein [unclassified Lentimonas]CAA6676380.1 Unannotated [Lentimonas sp. CC4]CAA6685219.1 Unannotated [Lentimonas sp. CC6]CAA7075056.1 FIG01080898: hypothetical protein [Lentimonas sp. CC4]CAA7169639.1 Unannotated [Lentimonas sp. CC21]CAA7182081.1 Unannotated [Lentimonas sp. CC8]
MKQLIIPASVLVFASLASAQPAITVYNENFGVVRDTVSLDLKAGLSDVTYSGVTAQLEPESVILRDPSAKVALSVVEQSYRGDPVDQARLLQMFEGQTIRFLKVVDGKEVMESGKIIRAPSVVITKDHYGRQQQRTLEPIVEVDGELVTRLPGQPLFPSLGDDSVLKPTLSWKLHSNKDAAVDAQLSYLTNGMSWKADYNLVLPEKGDEVTLTGWVSVENNTGKTFEDAKIKLIAGDVNKVEPPQQARREKAVFAMAMSDGASAPQVEEKKFDEFHMYSLPLATTLRDRETKQVEFVRAENVQTKKLYVYQGFKGRYSGGRNMNQNYGQNAQPDIAIYREIENNKDNGLSVPLPAGRMRFYRMDDDGQLEFTGENTIDHTAKNETIRVYLGNAFDLVGERTRTDFYTHPSRALIRETFEIEIRNRSEETVTVKVVEPLFRWSNWEIQKPSHDFEKTDSQTIEFPVTVAPDGTETVTYTVEYTW